jgi:predicted  nucleic acid-binding Zn-ribbon protein
MAITKFKNIVRGEKLEVSPPSIVLDLKKELKSLNSRIKAKEEELVQVSEDIKIRIWNIEHLQDHIKQKSARMVIANLTERRDDLVDEINSLNKDIRSVTISLKDAQMFEGKSQAAANEGEIASRLQKLVELTEQSIEANTQFFELRKSFGPYVGHDWPYSNPKLDGYQHSAWLREVKKYLNGKGKQS